MIFAKKSLGQNFLIDKNIVRKIINLVKIKGNHIIEIGPGKGALTDEILKQQPKSLLLIEKDFKLMEKLKIKHSNNNIIKIVNSDVLKYNFEEIKNKNLIIFGNLPYNISSQILVKMIKFNKWPPNYNHLIFMFQKELGDKITSIFPSSNYGRLSILSNYRLNILKKFLVSPNCFFPKPKVTSMVIHFNPKKEKLNIRHLKNLEKVTNILFSNKRKMINKNLKKIIPVEKIQHISDLKVNLRPADLKPEIYYKIANLIEEK